jgi:hypothetical protein
MDSPGLDPLRDEPAMSGGFYVCAVVAAFAVAFLAIRLSTR